MRAERLQLIEPKSYNWVKTVARLQHVTWSRQVFQHILKKVSKKYILLTEYTVIGLTRCATNHKP